MLLKVDGHCRGNMMPLTKTVELTRMLCVLKKLALEVIVQALRLAYESKLEGGKKLLIAFACKRTKNKLCEKILINFGKIICNFLSFYYVYLFSVIFHNIKYKDSINVFG